MKSFFVCGLESIADGGVCAAIRNAINAAGCGDFSVRLGQTKRGGLLSAQSFRMSLRAVQQEFGVEYATRTMPNGQIGCFIKKDRS